MRIQVRVSMYNTFVAERKEGCYKRMDLRIEAAWVEVGFCRQN